MAMVFDERFSLPRLLSGKGRPDSTTNITPSFGYRQLLGSYYPNGEMTGSGRQRKRGRHALVRPAY